MQPRVTAILVAPSGATTLDRTLEGLSRQSRPPEALVVVDAGGEGSAAGRLALSGAAQVTQAKGVDTIGAGVAHALRVVGPASAESRDEWLWILGADNAPEPRALEHLMATVEVAPSVAVAGPKLMRADEPGVISEFGETVTRFGSSIALVAGELDQGQRDSRTDVLAVAAGGMLVRRSVWEALGGFDPALPHVDSSLDFSTRARLAGHRVVLVPTARVLSDGHPEDFGRKPGGHARRARLRRAAQLHRRLVYAPAVALPFHWLSLVPLALFRSIWQLLVKNPGAVVGEFRTAFGTAFGRSHIRQARVNFARTKKVPWRTLRPLRATFSDLRERRINERDAQLAGIEDSTEPRASFIGSGGLWITVLVAVVGVVAFFALLGSPAVTGGGLLPVSTTVSSLWHSVGFGWHEIGTGFVGPADPFAGIVAVLGSITFWLPSTGIVLFYFAALPLSAVGAWLAARRITHRSWVPTVAALVYAVSPPVLAALQAGRLGAVVTHALLPFLVLAMIKSHSRWSSGAAASILFAVIAAATPSLIPALVIGWLGSIAARPRGTHRMLAIPLPAIALFVPLAIAQISRGTWWAIFADPGAPTRAEAASPLQLALGSPETGLNGWTDLVAQLGITGSTMAIVVVVALLPLGLLAIVSVFLPTRGRAVACLALALVGYLTAVAATHLQITGVGSSTTGVWAGAGLSLYFVGMVGAAAVSLDRIPRFTPPLGFLFAVLGIAASFPLIIGMVLQTSAIEASSGRILSAYVTAEAVAKPDVGTLVLTPQPDGSLAVSLERGQGETLDQQSTLDSTQQQLSSTSRDLTTLAGNLVSRSGYDPAPVLRELGVGFVLLRDSRGDDARAALSQRAKEALDGEAVFLPVGDTTSGQLWRYVDATERGANHPGDSIVRPIVLGSWALIFGSALLLAIPTTPRRRRVRTGAPESEQPATTFDEERDE
ncbi:MULTISPECIES: glycosyltransferase [unclassified Frondihabitans]|uniref:glycosyltransferase family 2 protein n=1 Tax=unclassified Frondihabitans TaxID=2626248 RepID=UPI000F4E8F8D|nr:MULTISPECIES: glycosyltransferase [unclassified Frondihabitans]RPE79081.1 GT2 family glycosyltransferase [Frondihabitans sp. PhB153]RPF09361.1 GT2 family glycosyltransferase [Frondihabitans sp. PhB161]